MEKMEVKEEPIIPKYKRMTDFCIDLYTQSDAITNRVLSGKALVNPEKGEMMFAQNAPRGKRSIEISRTAHGRLVRRPDGRYTLTFGSMLATERQLREQLLAEVRSIYKVIEQDVERVRREEIAAAKKEGGEDESK